MRESGMQLEDSLDSLRGLRSALADEQAAGGAGGPGSPEAAQVHGRLMSFEESLRALRAPDEQPGEVVAQGVAAVFPRGCDAELSAARASTHEC